jgi:hypothetical protein
MQDSDLSDQPAPDFETAQGLRHPTQPLPLASSPAEFARLFDRHPTWGYRRIYAGDIRVLRQAGRMLIPRSEIERFLGETVVYTGKESLSPLTKKATRSGGSDE